MKNVLFTFVSKLSYLYIEPQVKKGIESIVFSRLNQNALFLIGNII